MKISTHQLPAVPAEKPAEARPRQDSPGLEEDAALFRQSLDGNPAAAENQPGARGAEARHGIRAPGALRHDRHTAATHRHERGAAGVQSNEPGQAGAQHDEQGRAGAQRDARGGDQAQPDERGAAGAQRDAQGRAGLQRNEYGRAGAQPGAGGMGQAQPGERSAVGAQRNKRGRDGLQSNKQDRAGAQRNEPGRAGAAKAHGALPGAARGDDRADATVPDDTSTFAEADGAAGAGTGPDLSQFMAMQEARSHEIAAQKAGGSAQPAISRELVDKVADRILVSLGRDGQDREVRIRVKDTALQDTEVSVKYERGELVVNFMTQSAADQALLQNGSQALKASLEQALDGNVRVHVSAGADDAGDTGDRQRSRGAYLDEEEE